MIKNSKKNYSKREFKNEDIVVAVNILNRENDYKKELKCIFEYSSVHFPNKACGEKLCKPGSPIITIKDGDREKYLKKNKRIFLSDAGSGSILISKIGDMLKSAAKDCKDFSYNLLSIVSTIYASDEDEQLVFQLRNNIYTMCLEVCKEIGVELKLSEDSLLRHIIISNIVCASVHGRTLLKERRKDVFIELSFPVWTITKDYKVSLSYS